MKTQAAYSLPDWKKFCSVVDGIWEREYYTNQGPLANELENALQKYLGVKHVVCMTNSSIALMIALLALEKSGKVILPALSHINVAQSVKWAGMIPVFCDCKKDHPAIDPSLLSVAIDSETSAVVAVNPFGDACDVEEIEKCVSGTGIDLVFISDSVFGMSLGNKKFGNFGQMEIFSFHQSGLMNAADGACICTSNDMLAARLRNIRSSYGAGTPVSIPYTGNGRMSEIQAGLALLSLEQMDEKLNRSKKQLDFLHEHTINKPVQGIYSEILLDTRSRNNKLLQKKLMEKNIHSQTLSAFGKNPDTGMDLDGFEYTTQIKSHSLYISANHLLTGNLAETLKLCL